MNGTQLSLEFYETSLKNKLDAKLWGQTELQLTTANIVQGMTGRKRTGIILEFIGPDNKRYFAKTTAQLVINGLNPAVRGFMQRPTVNDNPDMP